MKRPIALTAGGSGGHITPLLAVAAELKRKQPDTPIIYIGQKGDGLADIPAADENIDQVFLIYAGKFRRYHGEGLKQLLDVKTMYLNARDAIFVLIGIWQSWRLLGSMQPRVVFSRGGFVSVPVALGAAMRHVPYITHDSDSMPSLANRIIARWAAAHAVALPAETYPYPLAKTVSTGIPLQQTFVPVTAARKSQYRRELAIPKDARMLFVIGGGLGSQRVNMAVAQIVPHLLKEFPDLRVVHGVGRANQSQMETHYREHISETDQGRVQVSGYLNDVYRYSGAADLVVTRAGATNLAEFAVQGVACVVVPSPFLTGGHQLKNAEFLAAAGAAVVVDEASMTEDPNRLAKQISQLLKHADTRKQLGDALAQFAKPDAAVTIAELVLAHAISEGKDSDA